MSLSSLNFGQIILTASSTAKADDLKLTCNLNTKQNSISCNIYSHYPTKCVGWVMVIIDIKVSTLVHRVQWPLRPSSGSWRIMYHLCIILVSSSGDWRHLIPVCSAQGEYLLPWRRQDPSTVIFALNLSLPRSSRGLNDFLMSRFMCLKLKVTIRLWVCEC